jgi:hypothetical protein
VFEKMLTYGNHVGLYSEEIGPSGEQPGNFPQAFTLVGRASAATDTAQHEQARSAWRPPRRRPGGPSTANRRSLAAISTLAARPLTSHSKDRGSSSNIIEAPASRRCRTRTWRGWLAA